MVKKLKLVISVCVLLVFQATFFMDASSPASAMRGASSSSASSLSTLAVPKKTKKKKKTQLMLTDKNELGPILQKYKAGLEIIGASDITRAYLTQATLEHVFGIEFKPSSDGTTQNARLSGFHHDYNSNLKDQIKPYYYPADSVDNGIREEFIAINKQQLPVYKTYFPSRLSREQIIELLAESLKNINKQEDSGERWVIEGTTLKSIIIRAVIDKATGAIVTFFPVTQRSTESIKEEQKKIQLRFKKFFFTDKNKPLRAPITQAEVAELLKPYSDGIRFNMILAEVPYPGFASAPQEWLFKAMYLPIISREHSNNVIVKKEFKKLYFSPEALMRIFTNDYFPSYLSRAEILKRLKRALVLFGGQRITLKQPFKVQFTRKAGDLLRIDPVDPGTGNNDEFSFLVKFNKKTSVIEDFFI